MIGLAMTDSLQASTAVETREKVGNAAWDD